MTNNKDQTKAIEDLDLHKLLRQICMHFVGNEKYLGGDSYHAYDDIYKEFAPKLTHIITKGKEEAFKTGYIKGQLEAREDIRTKENSNDESR